MEIPKRYSNFLLREIIEEFVHSERDRYILTRKYCDKRTIRQLADELGISETTVKNVMYNNSFLIFSILEEKSRKLSET